MRLNHECVRDTMLYLEDTLEYGHFLPTTDIKIKDYSIDEIKYTLKKLSEAGYITIDREDILGNFLVKSITYNGHQFIDSVRDNTIWKETKSALAKVTGGTLPIIQQLATYFLKAKLGI